MVRHGRCWAKLPLLSVPRTLSVLVHTNRSRPTNWQLRLDLNTVAEEGYSMLPLCFNLSVFLYFILVKYPLVSQCCMCKEACGGTNPRHFRHLMIFLHCFIPSPVFLELSRGFMSTLLSGRNIFVFFILPMAIFFYFCYIMSQTWGSMPSVHLVSFAPWVYAYRFWFIHIFHIFLFWPDTCSFAEVGSRTLPSNGCCDGSPPCWSRTPNRDMPCMTTCLCV